MSGRLYTSDVCHRLPGYCAPLAWLPQPSARRVPRRMPPLLSPMPAPTQATASPTDSPKPAYRSPSSVAAAWYSPGYVPREHPLRWSAHPLCTPAPAQALASLGVSVYESTTRHARALARACVVRGGSPRGCHGLYTADLVPSRPSGPGSRRPPLLAGLSGRITRPPCALHAGRCMPPLMQSRGRLPAEARRAPMPDLAVDTGHQASRRSTTSSVTVRHAAKTTLRATGVCTDVAVNDPT